MQLTERDKYFINKTQAKDLSYEEYRNLALDNDLCPIEKIGFPESYRKNFEELILNDILNKSSIKNSTQKNILDIGCGCSRLTDLLIKECLNKNHNLTLFDSKEMLELINVSEEKINLISGRFPQDSVNLNKLDRKYDFILIYSVLQIVLLDDDIYNFIDTALDYLNPGGSILIGDLNNIMKKNRFLLSEKGIDYHQKLTNTKTLPKVNIFQAEKKRFDDSSILSLLQRYRNAGFETYLLPQDSSLPLANRREDILIKKY